jgi:hypothetical protein
MAYPFLTLEADDANFVNQKESTSGPRPCAGVEGERRYQREIALAARWRISSLLGLLDVSGGSRFGQNDDEPGSIL